ncbi:hypothetical protein Hanom_Chr16g01438201 [Helianthus anomalus]
MVAAAVKTGGDGGGGTRERTWIEKGMICVCIFTYIYIIVPGPHVFYNIYFNVLFVFLIVRAL